MKRYNIGYGRHEPRTGPDLPRLLAVGALAIPRCRPKRYAYRMNQIIAFKLAFSVAALAAIPPLSAAETKNPLDQIITIRQSTGTLKAFFDSVSRQAPLEFRLVGLEDCTVGAFMWNRSVREVLQVALQGGHFTYTSFGRPNHYTVSPRPDDKVGCRRLSPAPKAQGSCLIPKGAPISIKCKDGPLHSFASILFSQSDSTFFLWNGAENYPVSANMESVELDVAMKGILSDEALIVNTIGLNNTFAIGLRSN